MTIAPPSRMGGVPVLLVAVCDTNWEPNMVASPPGASGPSPKPAELTFARFIAGQTARGRITRLPDESAPAKPCDPLPVKSARATDPEPLELPNGRPPAKVPSPFPAKNVTA